MRAIWPILYGLVLAASISFTASATPTTSYITQEVCVNSSNSPIYGDPTACPAGTTTRKLALGESLPYHKIDYTQVQISDSYPIKDANNVSLAVQTYFYPSPNAPYSQDAAWNPGEENFSYFGGYNILGADTNYVFFRGTWDGSGGWQPWWDGNCSPKAWILFPNTSPATIAYGGLNPFTAENAPQCSTSLNNHANVEWNSALVTYEWQSPSNSARKTLQTIYDFNFSNAAYDSFEADYFTNEFGVTRWEQWEKASSNFPGPGSAAMNNCPHATFTATVHGYTMYMQDCRDWSRIVEPAQPWNPNDTSGIVPNVVAWPLDVLYTGTNLLQNSHFQGSPVSANPTSCGISSWTRTYTSPVLNWGWDTNALAPMRGPHSYNCALQFSVPGTINGQVVEQSQSISSSSGNFSYGVTLWSPGSTGSVYVQVIGRDASGNLTDNSYFYANTVSTPRTFQGTFTINAATRTIVFAMYPQTSNVGFDFDGAWIAKLP